METWWGREQPRRKIYRQARRDADIEKPTKKTTGKQREMAIQKSQKRRLTESKKRWKHGGG